MTSLAYRALVAAALSCALSAAPSAQQVPAPTPPAAPPAPAAPPTPPARGVRPPTAAGSIASMDLPTRSAQIEVQIVISRWQGDRKLSSMPYSLMVNAGDQPEGHRDLARLRMGAEIPVPAFKPATPPDGAPPQPIVVGPVAYKPIGTNIDCTAFLTEDRQYRLQLTIEDSSVYAEDGKSSNAVISSSTPIFRSFRLSNTATLRDGQTMQFTAAADKVTGELMKVDVSVKAMK